MKDRYVINIQHGSLLLFVPDARKKAFLFWVAPDTEFAGYPAAGYSANLF